MNENRNIPNYSCDVQRRRRQRQQQQKHNNKLKTNVELYLLVKGVNRKIGVAFHFSINNNTLLCSLPLPFTAPHEAMTE